MKIIIDYIFKHRMLEKEPSPMKRFEVGWTKTDISTLQFLHKEASIRVQDTVKDHYEISKKAFNMLLLMVTISSVLVGYMLNPIKFKGIDIIILSAFIISLIAIYLLSELIRPNKFRAPGRMPSKVLVNDIYQNDKIAKKDLKKLIVYQELLNCQAQIELNQYYNTARLKIIDFIIRLLIISYVTMVVLTLILKTNS